MFNQISFIGGFKQEGRLYRQRLRTNRAGGDFEMHQPFEHGQGTGTLGGHTRPHALAD